MKATKTLVVLTVFIMVLSIGSLGFSHFEDNQELKEITGTVLTKLPGGYYLKTDSGDEYKLALGPPWFLDSISLKLKNGDQVSVKGIDNGYDVILVSSITRGGKTYDIFDLDSISEYGDHGCPGMTGHGMMGPDYRGKWGKSGNYRRGMMNNRFNYGDRRGMMDGPFNYGDRRGFMNSRPYSGRGWEYMNNRPYSGRGWQSE